MRGSVVFPVHADGKTIGVLIFDSREVRKPDERLLRTLAVIGGQIGQLMRRAQAEQALAARERRFRALVEHGHDAMVLYDRDLRMIYRSPTAKGISGYEDTERLGGPLLDLVFEDDQPAAAGHRRPPAGAGRRLGAVQLPNPAQGRPAALDRRRVHQPARRAGGRRAGGQLPRHRRADARARGARAQRALLPLVDRELGRHHRGRRPRLALHLHEPRLDAHPRLRAAACHRPPVPRLHAVRRRRAARRGGVRPRASPAPRT